MTNTQNINQGIIKMLDSHTANQIAAGEVVERPLSVVKELAENAIDAGSTRIEIRLIGDKKKSYINEMQVVDNGCGMVPADMKAAFGRHATSKIASIEELNHVHTLGFRGEALPSIASVSKVSLKSCPKDALTGYEIAVEEGKISNLGEVAMSQGTKIIIKDLFYNTPARKKFMKTYATECGQISNLVSELILSRPDIAFVLEIDGRKVLHSTGSNNVEKAILAVYGAEVVENLCVVDLNAKDLNTKDQTGDVTVRGFVSRPPFSRASRRYYHYFVNGRMVKSKELSNILETAYHSLMPENRYPVAILYFEVPTNTVDVNVHPAKTEIRFNQLQKVQQVAMEAIKSALVPKVEIKSAIQQEILPFTPQKTQVTMKDNKNIEENMTNKTTINKTSIKDILDLKAKNATQNSENSEADKKERLHQEFTAVANLLNPKTPVKEEVETEENLKLETQKEQPLAEDGLAFLKAFLVNDDNDDEDDDDDISEEIWAKIREVEKIDFFAAEPTMSMNDDVEIKTEAEETPAQPVHEAVHETSQDEARHGITVDDLKAAAANAETADFNKDEVDLLSLVTNDSGNDSDFAESFFKGLIAMGPGHKVEYPRDDAQWLADNYGITYIEAYSEVSATQPKLFTTEANLFKALHPMGQLNNSYIIASLNDELYIIDQHAAHERVLFEEFHNAFKANNAETSMLAVPVTVEIGNLKKELLFNNIDKMADFGFVLEYFGDASFIIRGVPLWYAKGSESNRKNKSEIYANDIKGFFIEIMDNIIDEKAATMDISILNQEEIFSMACKSAVKANDKLTKQEISWLLYNMSECEKPQTCPHGRPTYFKMTDDEIRKRFMRS